MIKNRIIGVILSVSCFIGCTWTNESNQEEQQRLFSRINKSEETLAKYSIDTKNWQITTRIPASGEFFLRKFDGDTLKRLQLNDLVDRVIIQQYHEIFPCGAVDSCYLLMGPKADTLWLYMFNGSTRIFYQGEYNHRYIHGELDPEEMSYFEHHSDSLGRLKGNNLPRLPGARLK